MAKFGIISAIVAGILFGAGWWLFISECATENRTGSKVEFIDALPLTGTTVFFILLLCFPWDRLDAENYEYNGGCGNIQATARVFLFIIMLIGFGSIIGSGILLTRRWSKKDELEYGISQLIASILVFISAVIWRAGKNTAPSAY